MASIGVDLTPLQKGLQATSNELGKFEKKVSTSMSAASKSVETAGKKIQDIGMSWNKLSLPIAAAGGFAIKAGADFEASMSQVAATMGTTRDKIGLLTETAKEMGRTTAFSAKEAGEALNYLALAGYDMQQQAAALPKVLTLASAGNMELAAASDMLTDSMSALGLASSNSEELMSNMNTMVDQMARTASKSNTSVSQLGEAILTVGGTAKVMKGGTAELNATLGLLADNGIKGSDAGTKLRNILLAMTPQTTDAAEAFEQLGLQTYDAQGKMMSMNQIFGQLNTSMADMTDEEKTNVLAKIFKVTDLKAVNALLATTEERWGTLSSEIVNSTGSAEAMAAEQLNNWKGQVTILRSSLEGLAIKISDVVLPIVKKLTTFVQGITDRLNAMSPTMTKIAVVIGAVVASIGPLLTVTGFMIATIIPKLILGFQMISKAVLFLGSSFVKMTAFMMANPFVAILAAVVALGTAIVVLWKKSEKFRAIVKYVTQSVVVFFSKAWIQIRQGVELLWLGIKTYFTAIPKLAATIWKIVKRVLKGEKIGEVIKDEMTKLVEDVKEPAKEIREKYQKELDAIQSPDYQEILAAEKAKQAAKEAGEETAAGFEEGLGDLPKVEPEKIVPIGFEKVIREPFEAMSKMETITPELGVAKVVELETEKLKTNNDKLIEEAKRMKDNLENVYVEVGDMIGGALNDGITALAEGIGQMAVGAASASDVFASIMGVVFDFTSQLGKSLIATGIGEIAFSKLLPGGGPAAIAAGVALVGLSAAAKGIMSKGLGGGSEGSSGGGGGGSKSGAIPLATGGLAVSPVHAIVGDNPNARMDPELIMPVSKLGNYLDENMGNVVNIQQSSQPNKLVAEVKSDRIRFMLEYDEQRLNEIR